MQRHFLVVTEPETCDRCQAIRRQCGREPQCASLQHSQWDRHHNVRADLCRAVSAVHTHTTWRVDNFCHLDAQAYVEPGSHFVHQSSIAPDGQIAEEVPLVLDLV